jgi:chemotaxis protein MotB
MARKRRHEEHENHERWLVSYADFITLLFAFFVVMYSISSVNDGKYRVLSETLNDAFLTSAQSLDPIQVGEKVRTITPVAGEYAASEPGTLESSDIEDPLDIIDDKEIKTKGRPEAEGTGKKGDNGDGKSEADTTLAETAGNLESALSSLIADDLITVTQTKRGVEVEMKSKMLFTTGSARLSRTAIKLLRDVADILKLLPNQVLVEGHTDNVPIRNILFPSNWELSAARAASVVHLLGRFGITPGRMAAIGYGEYRPTADNTSEDGRQKNRRVALIIKNQDNERNSGDIGDYQGRVAP